MTAPISVRRSLPPAAIWSEAVMTDGWALRTVRWDAARPARGSILFLNGRADFIEKYAETAWDWVSERGLGLMCIDWRGQGGSGRLTPVHDRGHVDSYDRWVDDLDTVAAAFVADMPGPHRIVAHSMGGHLTLRYLARGGSPVDRVALLAPMLGIGTGGLSRVVMRLAASVAVRLGRGQDFALAQHPYGEWQQRPERADLLTADLARFADEHWWLAQNPDLELGGVTWGWLDASYRSIAKLAAPGALEVIRTPVLALAGAHERLVDVAAIQRAVARIPGAVYTDIPAARHELLRETDAIRSDVLAQLDLFLDTGP